MPPVVPSPLLNLAREIPSTDGSRRGSVLAAGQEATSYANASQASAVLSTHQRAPAPCLTISMPPANCRRQTLDMVAARFREESERWVDLVRAAS
jgi:hypothetical protein